MSAPPPRSPALRGERRTTRSRLSVGETSSAPSVRRPPLFARLSIRLLLANVLLVFLPIAGILALDVYEKQMLTALERSLVQQARVASAALGGRTLDSAETSTTKDFVQRLARSTEARVRIFDAQGVLLADSAKLAPTRSDSKGESDPYRSLDRGGDRSEGDETERETRLRPLYRLGAAMYRWVEPLRELRFRARSEAPPRKRASVRFAVERSLAGNYGAAVEESPGQRSLTLHSALPIRDASGAVIGVVAVSQSTVRILRSLYDVRLRIFEIFCVSVLVAGAITLLFAATVSRPLAHLRDQAHAVVDARGRLRGRFRGSKRRDELGDLARALEAQTDRLAGHLHFMETFAGDVAHEFKNPLAAIRSAVELLGDTENEQERRRLVELSTREITRLERLLGSVREIAHLDAQIEAAPAEPVRLDLIARSIAESFALRRTEGAGQGRTAQIVISTVPVLVASPPDRLAQVIENLVDNALDFAVDEIRLTVKIEGEQAVLEVADDGPGIPAGDHERVFDRFYSHRPLGKKGEHAGLGLAIVKAIVLGLGGRVWVAEDAGARIVVEIPRVDGLR